MSIRSSKDLKRELLRRAIQEGRGPEMILLLQWCSARLRHEAEQGLESFQKFEEDNFGQPRSVRMLNILAAMEGSPVRYGDASVRRMLDTMSESLN